MRSCFFFILFPFILHSQQKIAVNDTCVSITFKEHLSTFPGTIDVTDIREIPGQGGYIMTGIWREVYNDLLHGFIGRLSPAGDLVWMKSYGYGANGFETGFDKFVFTSDNSILVFSSVTNQNEKSVVLKFDLGGNLVWKKYYTSYFGGNFFKPSQDGGVYFSGSNSNGNVIAGKLNADGSLQWSGEYSHFAIMNTSDFVELGNCLYVAGTDFINGLSSHLLKIDKASGVLIWAKSYSFGVNYYDPGFVNIQEENGRLLISGFTHQFNPSGVDPALYNFDIDGNCLSAVCYKIFGQPTDQYDNFRYSHNIRAGIYSSVLDSNDAINLKFTPSGVKTYSTILPGHQTTRAFNSCSDSGYIASFSSIGHDNGPNPWLKAGIIKNNAQGIDSSCYSSLNALVTNFSIPAETVSLTSVIHTASAGNSVMVEITSPFVEIEKICQNVRVCYLGTIVGPDTVCANQAATYIAHTFGVCGNSVFSIDSNYASVVNIKPDSIGLQFRRGGNVKLFASLTTGCGILRDSLSIYIFPAASALHIPDATICPGTSYLINAGTGYANYLWQDGSTDSTFIAPGPGTYNVTVTDHCGNVYEDEVVLSVGTNISFDIGPSLSKCNGDSVSLSAPAGFMSYNWTPNYNINTTSSQTVIVSPDVDTVYYCEAEKVTGCFGHDSVRVFVHHSPSINLGADTSLCMGDNLLLNAGGGFQQYAWNDGSSSQQITVQSAGTYIVNAITLNGCSSTDSFKVLGVFNHPSINLAKDSMICAGADQKLDAGNGFATYLWSTGSVAQAIQVNAVGIYWVKVRDDHGCSASDTVKITTIFSSPANFLPADTSICNYENLLVRPSGSYHSYLWNDGSTGNSMQANGPGIYWLQVSNVQNCTGKDSIVIYPKACLEGFYIPSAFSPNHDGKNDVYKPTVLGRVVKYKFTIYNRWGQKVFETSDIHRGWGGELNGAETRTDVFVWICNYQFQGQDEKFEKGTVVIIK